VNDNVIIANAYLDYCNGESLQELINIFVGNWCFSLGCLVA